MFAEDGVVRFAYFSSLRIIVNKKEKRYMSVEVLLTMNLRSLENVKRRTASIRSNGSSESLMLSISQNCDVD